MDQHAHPVAAHQGGAAVGVDVVHEPAVGALDVGGDDADDAVCTQTAAPVAQAYHDRGVQRVGVVGVEQHHEVVARAVGLEHVKPVGAQGPTDLGRAARPAGDDRSAAHRASVDRTWART